MILKDFITKFESWENLTDHIDLVVGKKYLKVDFRTIDCVCDWPIEKMNFRTDEYDGGDANEIYLEIYLREPGRLK